jgi:hypothetical protein
LIRNTLFKVLLIVLIAYVMINFAKDKYFLDHPSMVIVSNWHSSLDPQDGNTSFLHNLKYEAVVTNDGDLSDTVTDVRVILNQAIMPRIKSGETVILVNKRLKPYETYKINGKFVVDTEGSTDKDINLNGGIARFEVSLKPRNLFNW